MSENQVLDMNLLDMSMDEIEDLPGYEVPPTGEYVLKMTTAMKEINGKTFVETEYEVIECLKKDKDTDADGKVGSKFSSLYTIKGDGKDKEKDAEMRRIGLGKLKELLAGVAESTGETNVGVLVRDFVASALVQATVKRRQDREDTEKFYGNVKNLRLS